MEKCKICGKEFKKITSTHLKKHNVTMAEYLEKFEEDKHWENVLLSFINEYYIERRNKFIEYNGKLTYTVTQGQNRPWGLNDTDIKQHLRGEKTDKTIGIYFPSEGSKLIGFDIDKKDENLLETLYNTLINYNIPSESILCSFSGGKGYHVDIFLNCQLDKKTINEFYEIVLADIKTTKKIVELRGGNEQGYKLPLGIHQKTGNRCWLCNEYGIELNTKDVLPYVKKVDVEIIREIVEINCMEQFQQLDKEVTILATYKNTNTERIKKVKQIIEKGVKEIGDRHNIIYLVALYLKDVEGLCLNDCINYLTEWIKTNWSNNAIYGDSDNIYKDLQQQVKTIYTKGDRFYVQANDIKITLPEIKEIFSLDVGHKAKTQALRKLYYILLLHSKAYAEADGTFKMSYKQMSRAGAVTDRKKLSAQLMELEQIGKLTIVERNRKNETGSKNLSNIYKLNEFKTYTKQIKVFTLCNESEKCKDCIYKALCYLADDKERRKYIKGKQYKELGECPYNKRE